MKKFKLGTLITLFAMALFIFSCGEHDHSHDEDGGHAEETSQTDEIPEAAEVDKTSKEYASAFICPMYCKGSGSDAAGTCPACGMEYVANEDYKSNSEAAEGDGHDHDGDGHADH